MVGSEVDDCPFTEANWIWTAEDGPVFNYYLYARKSFDLQSEPSETVLSVTADSRYKLYINGKLVGQGPVRSDPRYQYYDTYDIESYLTTGTNVVAIVVHHFGLQGQNYKPGRPGFIVAGAVRQAENATVLIRSDSSWRLLHAPQWRQDVPRSSWATTWMEIYDARREPLGWRLPEFDDTSWVHATELGRPPVEPWTRLIPRDIPPLRQEVVYPVEVIDRGVVDQCLQSFRLDITATHGDLAGDVCYLLAELVSPVSQTIRFAVYGDIMPVSRQIWVNGEQRSYEMDWQGGEIPNTEVEIPVHSGNNDLLIKIGRAVPRWVIHLTLAPAEGLPFHPVMLRAPGGESGAGTTAFLTHPYSVPGDVPAVRRFHHPFEPELRLPTGTAVSSLPGGVVVLVPEELSNAGIRIALEARTTADHPGLTNPDALIRRGADVCTVSTASFSASGIYMVLDFGKTYSGSLRLTLDGRGGAIVDMGYAEGLVDGHVDSSRCKLHYGDRYITKDGPQTFELFLYKSMRYVQITVRNCPEPLTIEEVAIVSLSYPVEYKGSFQCSDALLTRVWDVSRWTLQLCMHDAFEDTPWREQGQWVGDAQVELMASYCAFGATRLATKFFRQIAQGQLPNGDLPILYPAKLDLLPNGIPTFTLQYVIALWDHYRFTGESALLTELYPTVQRVMVFFDGMRDEHRLLADLKGFVFLEWFSESDLMPYFGGSTKGEHTGANSLYYRALLSAAFIAEAAGDLENANTWRDEAASVREAVNARLFSVKKGVYVHTRDGDDVPDRVTVHDTVLAAYAGIAPEERGRAAMERLLAEGVLNPVREGSPYFYYFFFEALRAIGLHDRALELMRDRYGMMLRKGATSWWETLSGHGASRSHAWGCAPNYDLSAYVLGVRPHAPGFQQILIEPHPSDLGWARGFVPTPHGDVGVFWIRRPNRFSITATIPYSAEVYLDVPCDDPTVVEVDTDASAGPASVASGRVSIRMSGPGRITVTTGMTPHADG